MATTDQRWTVAALGVLALSVGVVHSNAPPSESEWLRLPETAALRRVVLAKPKKNELEWALPQAGEEAMLVNALYVVPEGEGSAALRAHLRM
ncbi:MAG: hypothetical protein WBG17_00980 [Burkholderiaceae bacterium]